MTSKNNTCFVYITLPGQIEPITAGKLVIDDSADEVIGRFVYGKSYLKRHDAVEIDPVELKLTDKIYETVKMSGIFGAIRDSMPDYWGRRLIERHIARLDVCEMDYLLYSPDDRIGALGFGLNKEPPAPLRKFNKMLDLKKLQSIADEIVNDEVSPTPEREQVEELLLLGTSMGGARPKAVVSDKDNLWLAKFNSDKDRWNNALVEHAMLNLAQECGLNVAQSKIKRVGGKDVLLVKRFDRKHTKDGYLRHRMFSALTALQTDDSPTSRSNWSYITLVEELRRFSTTPCEDARQLFMRMVFNALISNTDDHPRNHAFVAHTANDWRLSPAYDLTPTPMISIEHRDLAMVCGNRGRWANAKNMRSECCRFMLGPTEAESIIKTMAEFIEKGWYKTARRVGVSERDCEAIKSAFAYQGFFME